MRAASLASSAGDCRNGRQLQREDEQDPAELRVAQQRERRLAMPVEVGGLPQHRDDAVDPGELDERVDAAIVEPRGEQPEREADADLGAEPLAPAGLGTCCSRDSRRSSIAQGLVQRLGRELAADQAVVDAAAGRRLDQPGGVADRQQARTVGPGDRAERQDLEARLGPRRRRRFRSGRAARRRTSGRASRRARRPSARAADTAVRRAGTGTTHAKPRGATVAPEMHFDLFGTGERVFELRALHEGARHAETELPVEAIVGAARENARARRDRAAVAVGRDRHARCRRSAMVRTRALLRSSAPAARLESASA